MTKTRRLPTVTLGTIVLAGALIASGCASTQNPKSDNATRIEVRAKDFSFEPAVLTFKTGVTYELSFRNSGTTLHDWTVEQIPASGVAEQSSATHDMGGMGAMPGMGGNPSGASAAGAQLHIAAAAGGDGGLVFTPTRAGEYEYFCTVPGHRELGMRGKLVVRG